AVRESHRRQGIARSMLNKMVGRYPHAELYCVVGKVQDIVGLYLNPP
ncbi:acetyltransferase, partial [Pseudomonas savastanoi pv. glycinea str. race 4]